MWSNDHFIHNPKMVDSVMIFLNPSHIKCSDEYLIWESNNTKFKILEMYFSFSFILSQLSLKCLSSFVKRETGWVWFSKMSKSQFYIRRHYSKNDKTERYTDQFVSILSISIYTNKMVSMNLLLLIVSRCRSKTLININGFHHWLNSWSDYTFCSQHNLYLEPTI